MRRNIFLTCILILFGVPPEAATYYVAKTGSDANSCTQAQNEATPKLTINACLACLTPANADVLIIKGGTYTEVLSNLDGGTSLPSGTSWANAATIRGESGETVILQPTTENPEVRIEAKTYLIIEDIIVDGTNSTAHAVATRATSHHIRFNRVTARNSPVTGFSFYGQFIECNDCVSHDNGTTNLDHGYYPSGASGSSDITCVGCEAYNNAGYGWHAASGSPTRTVCDKCRLHHNASGGGLIADTDGGNAGNIIKNSLAYLNNTYGFRIYDDGGGSSLYNNTVYGNSIGINVNVNTTGARLTNNIAFGNSSVQILNQGTGTILTKNLITDPLFVNAASLDFHLQSGSVAVDSGADLTGAGVSTDFAGTVRPQGPAYDIGALEYKIATGTNQNFTSTANHAGAITVRPAASGAVAIAWNGKTEANVVVYSLHGQILATFNNLNAKGAIWNSGKSAAGVYLIKVKSGRATQTVKVFCGR